MRWTIARFDRSSGFLIEEFVYVNNRAEAAAKLCSLLSEAVFFIKPEDKKYPRIFIGYEAIDGYQPANGIMHSKSVDFEKDILMSPERARATATLSLLDIEPRVGNILQI